MLKGLDSADEVAARDTGVAFLHLLLRICDPLRIYVCNDRLVDRDLRQLTRGGRDRGWDYSAWQETSASRKCDKDVTKYGALRFEILPSCRRLPRELRQSNREIRRRLGFFSRALTAPSLCVASNAANHPQKRRKMLVLQAVLRHV